MTKVSRWLVTWLGILLACAWHLGARSQLHADAGAGGQLPGAVAAQTPATSPSSATKVAMSAASPRAVIDQYCVGCHNQQRKVAGLSLDSVDIDRLGDAPAVWEKVAHMLRAGAMPPAKMPRPDTATAMGLASWLEDGLDRAAAARPNAGKLLPHRLNRTEYANAIRDLLDLEISPSLLPADGSLLGFDNMAGVLSVSPTLLERYMTVARHVSRLAVGDRSMNVAPVTYTIDSAMRQDDRNDELPFGSRGVTVRHAFPLDGEYEIQVRLRRNSNEYIRGLGRRPQPLEIRLDGERLALFGEAGLMKGMPPPETYTQNDLGDPDWERSALDSDAGFNARVQAKAGSRVIAVAFPAARWFSDDALMPISGTANANAENRDGPLSIATIAVSGPFEPTVQADTPSRRKVFVCQPKNEGEYEACGKTILTRFARLAYRRPLVDKDVESLVQFCKAGLSRGFDGCVQSGLERVLASPHFLFRVPAAPATGGDGTRASAAGRPSPVALNVAAQRPSTLPQTPDGVFRIDDFELASRLSFFIWSSIPDDQLLGLAEQGKLREPAVMVQQARRMLADPRSRALIDNFAGQWLELRRMEGISPVEDVFPDWDIELRDALRQETERFLDSMMREDRPLVELLTANYTFVNERLARHYGIPNLVGAHFRRITLPEGQRVGLLGHGSILTVTSQANRTSPVLRGKWVLDNILGAPVPPPPPDVPALKPSDAKGQPLTGRAALEQHRSIPTCANCHARMDPWGFALENFDGIGRWRTTDGTTPINAADVLLDGTVMDGPAGVRQALLDRREQFIRTVSEKLMVYALGRPLEAYDRPALRKVIKDASPDYRWSAVILGVVNSMPFQFGTKGAE